MRQNNALTIAKRGYSKQDLLTAITQDWNLSPEVKHAADIHRYFVLYWAGSYLRNQVRDGMIVDDGITYTVIYHRSPSYLFNSAQVIISFRASTLLGNVAIVRAASFNKGS